MSESVYDLIDKLNEFEGKLHDINKHYDQLKEEQVPPEVREALIDIEIERVTETGRIERMINTIKNEIRAFVAAGGETIKYGGWTAAAKGGRVSWNDASLMGYAITHPEIKAFRVVGNPSASLSRSKRK
jgi:hypothetical protein